MSPEFLAVAREIASAIAELKTRFRYKVDKPFDSWRVMADDDGDWLGDCDDFAVTALWLLVGRSRAAFVSALIKGTAELWYVTTQRGTPHMTLRWRGAWICNSYPTPSPNCRFKKVKRAPLALVLAKLAVGKITTRAYN